MLDQNKNRNTKHDAIQDEIDSLIENGHLDEAKTGIEDALLDIDYMVNRKRLLTMKMLVAKLNRSRAIQEEQEILDILDEIKELEKKINGKA